MLRMLIKALVLPPGCCLTLVAIGVLLRRWRPRAGRIVMIAAGVLLWLISTPLVAGGLLTSLQTTPALPVAGALPPAQAIVVLSAEAEPEAPEYGQSVPGRDTLVRLHYGAHLHRRTGAPILVTGGAAFPDEEPVALAMQRTLEHELGARVTWVDQQARTTFENAGRAAELLAAADIDRVYLVTHAWHMPRARRSFEAAGVEVVPAPTGFRARPWQGMRSLLPHWTAVRDSYLALHEWLGLLFYATAH
ncbi:MAG TPA: YdcF family protein [Haliangium sp.]|nr:YdcF family protein [Haliangium sp.]